MIKFKDFIRGMPIVTEELHPEVKAALDDNITASTQKNSQVVKTIHRLLNTGQNPGIDAKPHRGSSRAVYFHTEPMSIKLDGKDANLPAVSKIAFPGKLDSYHSSHKLLGEHQNAIESDKKINHDYGIIREHPVRTGEYETNTHTGVLAPHLGTNEHNHYLHQGRVEPLDSLPSDTTRKLTINGDFSNGISHEDIYNALMMHHNEAHGKSYPLPHAEEKRAIAAQSHPLVRKLQNFVANSGNHPGDLGKSNMGVWQHPHTGEKHIVVQDYGFGHEVPKLYEEANRNELRFGGAGSGTFGSDASFKTEPTLGLGKLVKLGIFHKK